MNRGIIVAIALLALSGSPSLAASPEIEAAAKTLAQLETDTAKLQNYCKIIKDMDAAGDDDAKIETLADQLQDLLTSFGEPYQKVLELSESADSESADGQALEAAFSKLDEKCGA